METIPMNLLKTKELLILGLTCLATFTSCSNLSAQTGNSKKEANAAVKQLTEADDKTTVTLAVGSSFDIKLKGNPTTGYSWVVEKAEGSAVAQKGEQEYVQDKGTEGRAGAGGAMTFHFEVKEAGKATIALGYLRPWEKEKPIKTFNVTIDAQKK
jgi:predicted secreted protein